MNTFMENLTKADNTKLTENGGKAYKSTLSKVYDMFAFAGSYRSRSENECIELFEDALLENEELAMKCLFWVRDCRGGAGERRFFRVCFKYLCKFRPKFAIRNLEQVSEFGRWDDLIYSTVGTPVWDNAFEIIKKQLALDVQSKTPSLLAKWLPSENASAEETKETASIIRRCLGVSHKDYRKMLSLLRSRINIVEKLMSENRWDEIEFDKIPSKAGLVYKNAFARRDILAKKYEHFIKSDAKVNAGTLFPYEIVKKAWKVYNKPFDDIDRLAVDKYWENQKDYLNGAVCKMMCVVDTSSSMTWTGNSIEPIDVAVSLGMYCAERLGGDFKDHFITFSRNPELIKIEGADFVDKAYRIRRRNQCENTDLIKTFELLRKVSLKSVPEDRLNTIVIISDMEIDRGANYWDNEFEVESEMERERKVWEADGLEMPRLIYWNVNARSNTILDSGDNVSYVSGASPSIFQSVLTGKTGKDLMLEVLLSDRYSCIK